MAGPVYLSRRRVEAGEWTFDVTVDGATDNNLAIPAGDYYLWSPTASESLVDAIDDLLEANSAGENFTVTFSMTTGKMTIACQTLAALWSFTFDQQSFADWCGFGSTLGWSGVAGASQESPEVCQGVIFANSGRSNYMRRPREYGFRSDISHAGPIASIATPNIFKVPKWEHQFEPDTNTTSPSLASGTWDPAFGTYPETEALRPWTWMDFWDHHASDQAGQPFRIYSAPGASISAYEDTYVLVNAADFNPTCTDAESTAYWKVVIEAKNWTQSA